MKPNEIVNYADNIESEWMDRNLLENKWEKKSDTFPRKILTT